MNKMKLVTATAVMYASTREDVDAALAVLNGQGGGQVEYCGVLVDLYGDDLTVDDVTSALTGEARCGRFVARQEALWCVEDTDGGGTWRPEEEGQARIDAALIPEIAALSLCGERPILGEWKS